MKNMDVGDSDSSANSSNVDIVTAGQNIRSHLNPCEIQF